MPRKPLNNLGTLKKIANEVGVSVSTVSNVLNGRTKAVWQSTAERAERIRKAAEKFNYVPHASARTMRTGRFGAVGLLSQTHSFPIELIASLHLHLAHEDFRLTTAEILQRSKPDDIIQIPKLLKEQCVDGMIVHEIVDIPAEVQNQIMQLDLSVVWVESKNGFDSVYIDEFGGCSKLTQALIDRGHRSIAFIGPELSQQTISVTDTWHYRIPDRISGYHQSMVKARLEPRLLVPEQRLLKPRAALGYLRDILASADRPTGLVAYDVKTMLGIAQVCGELRLAMPEDVEIATFVGGEASIELLKYFNFVGIEVPWFDVGKSAVSLMMSKLSQSGQRCSSAVVPYGEVVIREPAAR